MVKTLAMGVVLSLFSGVGAKPQVPCYFIFGDSLVDNGNNNVLQSLARADYLPYGIDFNGGPTGRFSNGKTNVDVIGTLALSITGIGSYECYKRFDVDKSYQCSILHACVSHECDSQHLYLHL